MLTAMLVFAIFTASMGYDNQNDEKRPQKPRKDTENNTEKEYRHYKDNIKSKNNPDKSIQPDRYMQKKKTDKYNPNSQNRPEQYHKKRDFEDGPSFGEDNRHKRNPHKKGWHHKGGRHPDKIKDSPTYDNKANIIEKDMDGELFETFDGFPDADFTADDVMLPNDTKYDNFKNNPKQRRPEPPEIR